MIARRFILAILLLGFGWGTFTHALDYIDQGWAPYHMATPDMNLFWNALVFFDAAVFALLLSPFRRTALVAATALVLADVAVNSYAAFGIGLPGFPVGGAFQSAFLGFILGSLPVMWPMAE